MAELTERRKADRAKMAAILIERVRAAGATAEIDEEWPEICPRAIMVRIRAPGGARISVEFDGDSPQPNVFVQTWNTDGAVYLAPGAFPAGEVNPHHLGKVNRVAYGFQHLCELMECDVRKFVDGSGYAPADHPRVLLLEQRRLEREAERAKWEAENPGVDPWLGRAIAA